MKLARVMECFKLLTEFACHVVHSFTKGVFETDRPQASQFICDTSGSYSPMSNAESEWVRYTFDDTFIYQEYSNFPNRDCCGREAIASAKLEFPIAAHDLFTDEDSEDPMGCKMQRPPFTETLKRALIWGSVVSLLVAGCKLRWSSVCLVFVCVVADIRQMLVLEMERYSLQGAMVYPDMCVRQDQHELCFKFRVHTIGLQTLSDRRYSSKTLPCYWCFHSPRHFVQSSPPDDGKFA